MASEDMGVGVIQASPRRSGIRTFFERAAILAVFGAVLYAEDRYAQTHEQPTAKTAPALAQKP